MISLISLQRNKKALQKVLFKKYKIKCISNLNMHNLMQYTKCDVVSTMR